MKTILATLLFACAACSAYSQILFPGSISPDGKVALFYQHNTGTNTDCPYDFYFRETTTLKSLCGQLVPPERKDLLRQDDDSDTCELFERIADNNDAKRNGEIYDHALDCEIIWSQDSKWLSIDGGAHKFSHRMIYHSVEGKFEQVMLPEKHSFIDYFNSVLPNPEIKNFGVQDKCWLSDGVIAVDSYPYLLLVPDYDRVREKAAGDLFFYLDCRTKSKATILGFCR